MKENIGGMLQDTGIGKEFLGNTTKAQRRKQSPKIRNSL
jgi:hypothetical protein